MTTAETTNVSANAAAAIEGAKKREVSPQAKAALELHRARANLGLGLLAVLEAGASGNLETLKPMAEDHLKKEAEAKAAAEAERRANMGERGAALVAYREKSNDALALAEYLKSTGVDVEELMRKAKEAPAAPAA